MIKIRKATKNDLDKIINLKKEWDKEFNGITGTNEKLNISEVKKEFYESLNPAKGVLLVIEENGIIEGYLQGDFLTHVPSNKRGYIGDIFVKKEFRKRNLATKLINEFTKIVKNKKFKSVQLHVNIKNKRAYGLYQKTGFEMTDYKMEKKIK